MADRKPGEKKKKPGPKGSWKDTPEIRAIILKMMYEGADFQTACQIAKIDPRTVQSWMEQDQVFCNEITHADGIEIKDLISRVKEKDPWKLLKNRGKSRYKDEIQQNIHLDEFDRVDDDSGSSTDL